MNTHAFALRAALGALAMAAVATADVIDISYDGPFLDRWNYPFNATPGARPSVSIFGAVGEDDFDNRDGQMLIGFDTGAEVPIELGTGSYDVLSATLTVMYDGAVEFVYDDTSDPYTAFLDPDDPDYVEDADPGQPMELFGAGFRNGFDAATFMEGSPHGPIFGFGVRNAFAQGFDAGGAAIDVSNNVREAFDPTTWAVGQITGVAPGDVVPAGSEIVFEIDVADPSIQEYLREAMDTGRLRLMVTSLHLVEQQGGSFPTIYTKENALVVDGVASAARLELTVDVIGGDPADVDGDGVVNVLDLVALILAWGPCPAEGECPADVDGDGVVDVLDLVAVILAWS